MNGWILFWKIACIVGFASFFVLVLAVIPFGAMDILKLFRHLSRGGDEDEDAGKGGDRPQPAAPRGGRPRAVA